MRILFAAALAAILTGCMSLDSEKNGNDPFPKPIGPKIIPLEDNGFFATYRYVEFDSVGRLVMRLEALRLDVRRRAPDVYGYAFESDSQGILLRWMDAGPTGSNRDSAGVYIVGAFKGAEDFYDSVPVYWLPQFPKAGTSWQVGSRMVELVHPDTAYFSDLILKEDAAAPVRYGFQRHPTVLIKEREGDTLTHYHFRRGVGCLAFERTVGGRLRAAGTITSV